MFDDRRKKLMAQHKALIETLTLHAANTDLIDGQRELAQAWLEQLRTVAKQADAPLSAAFIGSVGRGKSTLIAAATGLHLPMEPVGDGRTSLGETHIMFEERSDICIEVTPIPEDILRMELQVFIRDLWSAKAVTVAQSRSEDHPSEERYGLLRAWLLPGVENPREALARIADSARDVTALEQDLLSRIDFTTRIRPLKRILSNDPEGLSTLKQLLFDLMEGTLANAPAPQTVRLRIPMTALGYSLATLVDTQGIEPNAPDLLIKGRADLQRIFNDINTLPILCSEYASAPDGVTIQVLKALGGLAVPLSATGRSLRIVLVDQRERIRNEALPFTLPDSHVVAIDARREGDALRQMLEQMVEETRLHRLDTWEKTLTEATKATSVLEDVEQAAQARALDLRLWWAWDAALARSPHYQQDGLAELASMIENWDPSIQQWAHLHAAIRQRGRDLYSGIDLAKLGSWHVALAAREPFIDALLDVKSIAAETFASKDTPLAAHGSLRLAQFQSAVRSYFDELQQYWGNLLTEYFKSENSNSLWTDCENRWGMGPGYIPYVAERFRMASRSAQLSLSMENTPHPPEKRLPERPPLFLLREVTLHNFRGIEKASIPLGALTVLVGENGTGKTSWLEGITAVIGAILPEMGAEDPPSLTTNDVRQVIRELGEKPDRQYQYPMIVSTKAVVQGRALQWARRIDNASGERATANDDALRLISRQIGIELRAHSLRQIPVLAYYGTQRLWPPDLMLGKLGQEVGTRVDGYKDCLKAASSHLHMMEWMRTLTYVELQKRRPVTQLRGVEQAVIACIEEASRFYFDVGYDELHLEMKDGRVLPFRQLSDGYRNIVAMVADIAWRASVLNPQLGVQAPALAEGVVLIDEIDLHLHPNWQRRVLADLRRAFPRLQFITTTHSPFIIQSLEPGQLFNLDPDARNVPYANRSPEDIAEHVMGVDIPQRSERFRKMTQLASEYYTLLDQIPAASEQELAALKQRLDVLEEPFSLDAAFTAYLRHERLAAEKGVR